MPCGRAGSMASPSSTTTSLTGTGASQLGAGCGPLAQPSRRLLVAGRNSWSVDVGIQLSLREGSQSQVGTPGQWMWATSSALEKALSRRLEHLVSGQWMWASSSALEKALSRRYCIECMPAVLSVLLKSNPNFLYIT